MTISVVNVSPVPRTAEYSPFVNEEHYDIFLEKFLQQAREARILIQAIIYTGDRLVIYVESNRPDWDVLVDIQLYGPGSSLNDSSQ